MVRIMNTLGERGRAQGCAHLKNIIGRCEQDAADRLKNTGDIFKKVAAQYQDGARARDTVLGLVGAVGGPAGQAGSAPAGCGGAVAVGGHGAGHGAGYRCGRRGRQGRRQGRPPPPDAQRGEGVTGVLH